MILLQLATDVWEAIFNMIAAGPSGKSGVSSILLSAPGFDDDFSLWAGPVFAMLESGVGAIEAEEMIGVVCFHPKCEYSDLLIVVKHIESNCSNRFDLPKTQLLMVNPGRGLGICTRLFVSKNGTMNTPAMFLLQMRRSQQAERGSGELHTLLLMFCVQSNWKRLKVEGPQASFMREMLEFWSEGVG